MRIRPVHSERHASGRTGWLRAAVLGANDGIITTASLIIGVAAAGTGRGQILVTGIASLAAGAMAMAAGEYVSVSSQRDTEHADLAREKRELDEAPEVELKELAAIYVDRGVSPALARQVAEQLTAKDALAAHARDELGISELTAAKPIEAAVASALMFASGSLVPLAIVALVPAGSEGSAVAVGSLLLLAVLGAVAAKVGGAEPVWPTIRVAFWGALAMATTAGVGALFGVAL